ncbi:MAG: hypothetical protein WBX27_01035, partial [Specibacter sp.]
RLNVWTSLLVFLCSLILFLILTFVRRSSVTDSVFLAGREPALVGAPETSAGESDAPSATGDSTADDDGDTRVPPSDGAAKAAGSKAPETESADPVTSEATKKSEP